MKSSLTILWLFAALAVFFVANLFFSLIPLRWDLTASQEHLISPETRRQLQSLEAPVTIRYYASKSDNTIPYSLRVYGEKVEYFLDILEQEAGAKIKVIRYDPKPGSDAEKTAKFDEITPHFNRDKNVFFFGLSVSCLDQKDKIPFLTPERKELLEFDILQLVKSVTSTDRKKIGIIGSLPVMGGEYENEQGKGVFPPWLFVNELRKIYDVLEYNGEEEALGNTPPDLLLLLHPIGIPDSMLRRIDQYLAHGGKAIVLLDSFSGAIGMINPNFQKELMSSQLDPFLKTWGVNYEPTEVVADVNLRSEVDRGYGPESIHTVLDIPHRYINKTDPITSGINRLGFPFSGHIWPTEQFVKRVIPLVTTSEVVSVVPAQKLYRADRDRNIELQKSFNPDGIRRVLAAKVLGPVAPAYPSTKGDNPTTDEQSQLVIFADSDFIFDPFAGETIQVSKSQSTLKPFNGNIALLSNAIDALIGDGGLAVSRGKGAINYPFLGLSDIKVEIEAEHTSRQAELLAKLEEAEQKLEQLPEQTKDTSSQKFFETKKQRDALLAKRDEVSAELSSIDREIDYKLSQVKNRIQWANILAMPLLIFIFGSIVIFRRNSTSRAR